MLQFCKNFVIYEKELGVLRNKINEFKKKNAFFCFIPKGAQSKNIG